MRNREEVDLMEAAHRLAVDYGVARRLVLTHALKAERRGGRWIVDATDLERLVVERDGAATVRTA